MDSTKTGPKSRGKSCFFQCFKPNIHDSFKTTSSPRQKSVDPLLTYIAVAEKEGIVLPTILSTTLITTKGGKDQRSGYVFRRKRSDSSLRHALVAAFNEISLGKKITKRRKKAKENLFSSSTNNIETGGDKTLNQEPKITPQSYSRTSSSSHSHYSPSFTPSSLSSSTSSSSSLGTQASGSSFSEQYCALRSLPLNGIAVSKQKQEVGDSRKGCRSSNNTTMCMFLTSLLVLVLYGKFYAILCTSIGFFVVSPRRRRPCNGGCLYEETDYGSIQYKKKIIMESMLERRNRNNSRV